MLDTTNDNISELDEESFIKDLIDNDEIGFVLLRLVQVLGRDNFEDLDSETLFFIVSTWL